MRFKSFSVKKRRGLSSIVGALLFVVLMVAAFAVLGVALTTQTDIASTGRDVAAKDLQKQQEDFAISSILQPVADDLEVNLINLGQNPTEIFTLVITEVDDAASGFPTTTYEIPSSTSFLPPGDDVPTDILSITPIFLDLAPPASPDLEYEIKVISSLGTIEKTSVFCNEFNCGPPPGAPTGPSSMVAQLFLDGPNGVNSKTSTIIMFVTNNGEQTLTDVGPLLGLGADCDDMWLGNIPIPPPDEIDDVNPCALDSPQPVTLIPGQSAFFKWDGTIAGEVDDRAIFCNQAQGTDEDLNVITSLTVCDDLTVINPNDCGGATCPTGGDGGESIILIDDLLIRPSIFMALPSPFGDTDGTDTGVWALNLANPTREPMSISKVTILAYPPGGNSQDVVFQSKGIGSGTNNCLVEDIEPNTGPQPQGFWECPRDNILMWQSTSNPILLQANSTQSFVARVTPHTIKTNFDNLDALIVQGNVYSTFGSFGKGGYQSSMYDANGSIVNVYLTNSTNINLRDQFIHNMNNLGNYTDITMKAVVADMDNVSTTTVEPGMRFIINVPREWTFNNFISCDGFDANDGDGDCNDPPIPTAVVHSDGSTQIIGTSIAPIGDGTNDARMIEFSVKTAPVKAPRLFVMYMLADGETINTQSQIKTIGPLNEVVLNVDP